ncbi:MAG: hypothetical protein EOM91_12500 [Sphingobacteriia bacterium]|nr:hypothetical protein [Sphingobacteriia bacterium]
MTAAVYGVLRQLHAEHAAGLVELDTTLDTHHSAVLGAVAQSTPTRVWLSGSGTWTVPDGVRLVYVTLCGGGGAVYGTGYVTAGISRGGGGAALLRRPHLVEPGAGIAYSVGAAGTGAAPGGASTFGILSVGGGGGASAGMSSAPGGASPSWQASALAGFYVAGEQVNSGGARGGHSLLGAGATATSAPGLGGGGYGDPSDPVTYPYLAGGSGAILIEY